MKTIYTLIFILVAASITNAQDIIYKQDGGDIKAKVIGQQQVVPKVFRR